MLLGSWLLLAPSLAEAAPVKIAAVTAKSSYTTPDASFPADNVKDGKSATPWFEGDSGSGVGSWIEVDLGGPRNVTRIGILPGDWSGGWAKANRPKELEVKFSDGTATTWTLADEYKLQELKLPAAKSTSIIRFKINQIFSGTAFPDTAISEILIYDDAPDPYATVTAATASSEFPPDVDGNYFASQSADNVRDTYWCEGNKTGDGVGEWLQYTFAAPTRITAVSVCSGMCTTSDLLKKGNAPSKVTLTFSDGTSQVVDLKSLMPIPSKVTLTAPVTTGSVKLTINEVRKGTDYDDACLSEITFLK
jgi:F5/8 type C domain